MKEIEIIPNLSVMGFEQQVTIEKTAQQWQDELIEFGFISLPNRRFAIPYQNNPLYVAIAEHRFAASHGTNPRVGVPRNWKKDTTFRKIIERNNIKILESSGFLIEGYDFPDHRSVQEIGSFIGWFEKEYRAMRVV